MTLKFETLEESRLVFYSAFGSIPFDGRGKCARNLVTRSILRSREWNFNKD